MTWIPELQMFSHPWHIIRKNKELWVDGARGDMLNGAAIVIERAKTMNCKGSGISPLA